MAVITASLNETLLRIEFRDQMSRNSFTLRAAEELIEICRRFAGRFEAMIFTAPGRVFCSGGNLADYAAMASADPGKEVNRRIFEALEMITQLPVPTVCLVQGDCFGGGVELISAFDLVLSSPYALFGFWQRKIGITFGWGGGVRLERRLGQQRMTQLALSGATIGSLEAQRIGLIDGIVIEPLLLNEGLKRAKQLCELPKAPVAPMKSWTASKEQEIFETVWWNEDHQAILGARKLSRDRK